MESQTSIAGMLPANPEEQRSQWQLMVFGENPIHTLRRVLIWSVSTVFIFHTLLVPIQIIGTSMSPTYRDRSYNLINKLAYLSSNPKREDIIALEADGELLLKRIVALPGETVGIHNRKLVVNGNVLQDNFAGRQIPWEVRTMRLAPDEYFVIGDNRSVSVFGRIDKDQIVGKIIF